MLIRLKYAAHKDQISDEYKARVAEMFGATHFTRLVALSQDDLQARRCCRLSGGGVFPVDSLAVGSGTRKGLSSEMSLKGND